MIHGFDEATGGAVAQEKVEAVTGGEVGGGLDGAAVAEDVGAAGTEHGHGVALADTELQHVESHPYAYASGACPYGCVQGGSASRCLNPGGGRSARAADACRRA